jgi:predicted nuclease of predicted toxin-antitoxin system
VKFLVDANLPPDLAIWLGESGHEAVHVDDVLKPPALDAAILHYARAKACVLVTKDSDFVQPRNNRLGPPVVWVRCGNLKLAAFREWFAERSTSMIALLAQGERVIELW